MALSMTTIPWGFDVATSSLPALLVSTYCYSPVADRVRSSPRVSPSCTIGFLLSVLIMEQYDIIQSVEVVMLDGPDIMNELKQSAARTFREYSQDVFLPYVEHQLSKPHIIYIV